MQVNYDNNGLISGILWNEKDNPKQVKKMRDRMHKQIAYQNKKEEEKAVEVVAAAAWGYIAGVAITAIAVIADKYINKK